jgi:hypothetical protein
MISILETVHQEIDSVIRFQLLLKLSFRPITPRNYQIIDAVLDPRNWF